MVDKRFKVVVVVVVVTVVVIVIVVLVLVVVVVVVVVIVSCHHKLDVMVDKGFQVVVVVVVVVEVVVVVVIVSCHRKLDVVVDKGFQVVVVVLVVVVVGVVMVVIVSCHHKLDVVVDKRFQVAGVEGQVPQSVGKAEPTRTDVAETSCTVRPVVRHVRLRCHWWRWPGFIGSLAAPLKRHARLVIGRRNVEVIGQIVGGQLDGVVVTVTVVE